MRQWMTGFLFVAAIAAPIAARAEDRVSTRVIYSLPFDEGHAGFDAFNLRIALSHLEGGWLAIRYEVPPDLIGQDGRFMTMFGQIDGEGDNVDLFCSETGSDARCVKSGNRLSCAVKFRSLTPDAAAVEAFLRAKYGDDHLAERLFASKIFGLDAIGTLDITVTPEP